MKSHSCEMSQSELNLNSVKRGLNANCKSIGKQTQPFDHFVHKVCEVRLQGASLKASLHLNLANSNRILTASRKTKTIIANWG